MSHKIAQRLTSVNTMFLTARLRFVSHANLGAEAQRPRCPAHPSVPSSCMPPPEDSVLQEQTRSRSTHTSQGVRRFLSRDPARPLSRISSVAPNAIARLGQSAPGWILNRSRQKVRRDHKGLRCSYVEDDKSEGLLDWRSC